MDGQRKRKSAVISEDGGGERVASRRAPGGRADVAGAAPTARRERHGGHAATLSTTASARAERAGAAAYPFAGKRSTHRLILRCHDAWTKVTLSGFYDEVCRHSLSAEQCAEWLRFRSLLAARLVLACNRLTRAGLKLSLVPAIQDDNQWLAAYAKRCNVEVDLKSSRLQQVELLLDFVDQATVTDSNVLPGSTAVWAISMSCWQGWKLTLGRARAPLDERVREVGEYLARHDKVHLLLDTQRQLDDIAEGLGDGALNVRAAGGGGGGGGARETMRTGAAVSPQPPSMAAAPRHVQRERAFCGALERVSDFYEELLFDGWMDHHATRCGRCNRLGHTNDTCLFKAKAFTRI